MHTPWLLADVAAGAMVPVFGVLVVVVLGVIVFVEALVLRLLRWANFGPSLLDALLANLVSTVVGVVLIGLFSQLNSTLGVVIAWALSVGIEGGILLLRKKQPAPRTWVASLAANTASYAVLVLFIVLSSH